MTALIATLLLGLVVLIMGLTIAVYIAEYIEVLFYIALTLVVSYVLGNAMLTFFS